MSDNASATASPGSSRRGGQATRGDLRARPAERGVLSLGQQRLWFLERWLEGSPVYHIPVVLTFDGPLDPDRLVASLQAVAARHDVLFSVFADEGGQPRQRPLEDRKLACAVIDLTDQPAGQRSAQAGELILAHSRRPFDLAKDPMLRAALYKIAGREHRLALTFHHIASDGWSIDVFQSQLLDAYDRGTAGADPPLQYADYALWQREHLRGLRLQSGLARWARDLDGAPPLLDLGPDHPRPAEVSYRGKTASFPVAGVPLAGLEALGTSSGATLYMVLLAAFQVLVARHSGSDDLVLGSPSAARGSARLDELVGFFVDSLVIRTSLAGDPSFRELISRSRSAVIQALSRSATPFDLAVSHLRPERSLSYSPIVQVTFAYHEEQGAVSLPGGTQVTRAFVPTDTAKFDLTWSVYRGPDGLRLEVEYSTDLFEPATIEALAGHWRTLLGEVAASPDTCISHLGLMSAAERQSLERWSGLGSSSARPPAGTRPTAPAATIPELVAAAAAAAPDEVAVICDGGELTYRELDARASALARRLRDSGAGPQARVGVLLEPSLETVVASLAVLKAGGAYLPLDSAFPAERIEFMLTDAGASLVLAHSATAGSVPAGHWRVLDLDAGLEAGDSGSRQPFIPVHPDNACYVIFTSGTTGRPKGTLVTHANVTALISSARQRLEVGPGDVWTMFHSLAFDFSVWEIWGALLTGGRVIVVPTLVSRDPDRFYGLVRNAGVTVLSQTPSAFRQFEAADAREGAELSLRAVVFGGEALDQASVRRWASRHGYDSPRLINMYGITETTVHVTFGELREELLGRALTQLGAPLPGVSVQVLDERGELCPVGVPGEMYVGGSGVTRGYLDRPGLTAERFVPDHLGGSPGGRLYRSGDLARWNADGGLEYLGRSDAQVKVRGYRIELGEIEAALAAHPGVGDCVVLAHNAGGQNGQAGQPGQTGQTDLAAYLVPREAAAPSASDLRTWLGKRLPAYMIPRAFVTIGALPLTAQGKIDRQALPEPEEVRPDLDTEFAAPRPGAEETLAGIWSQVLRVDRVGRHDNFFDLGGDSIRSIQVLGQARAAGIGITLQDLFRYPTLAELAQAAAAAGQGRPPEARPALAPFALLAPEERDKLPAGLTDAYPMAELQVGMVYEMELNPDRSPYHNVDSLCIAGPFDEAKFRQAVALVVERHPILRTSFDLSTYSEPVQLVHASAQMPFMVADLRGLRREAQEGQIARYVTAQRGHLFDHTRPPLLRVAIHVLSDELFQWTVTEHHAIFDGWSLHSTFSEIAANYQQLLAGQGAGSAPPVSSYRDFIVAERAAIESADSERFWLDKMADRPDCRLPRWEPDRPGDLTGESMAQEWRLRSEKASYGAVETLLPAEICDGLAALARRCGVPVKSVVLAAHLRVMSLVTGNQDVLVGLVANGRLEEEGGTDVRGMFLNTVPLRMELRGGGWIDLIQATFDAERELLPHRRYPVGALRRKLGSGPLFEVLFLYLHFHVLDAAFGAGRLEIIDGKISAFSTMRVEPTDLPLTVGVIRSPYSDQLLLSLDYRADVLTENQVLLLRGYYLKAFQAMIADPRAGYHQAALLSEAEQALAASWNDTATPTTTTPLHDLITAQAVKTPGAIAVEAPDTTLTYASLDTASSSLARHLIAARTRPGDIIGVHLVPSALAVISILAIWKAGAAFLPLDPDLPTARIATMINDARPARILTMTPTTHPQLDLDPASFPLDPPALADAPGLPLPAVSPHQVAYLMYTSGTTGEPKACMNHQGAMSNYTVAQMLPRLRAAVGDAKLRLPAGTSAFISDFFIGQLATLADGHTLVILDRDQRQDPRYLVSLAADPDRAVTAIECTTNQLHLLVEAGLLDAPHPPRIVMFVGEACPPDLWATLRRYRSTTAIHSYGPTETMMDCTEINLAETPDVLIGRPYGNTIIRILDSRQQPVAPGTTGELCIGGTGVGYGYLNRPAETAAAFIPDPWGPPASRLYRTGDLARYTRSGALEFRGRNDLQIKIQGQRVEPEEIEAVLRAHPDITDAAVTARRTPAGHQLTAHLLAAPGTTSGPAAIRAWLAQRLPAAAIPASYRVATSFPTTLSGKLDRKTLAAQAAGLGSVQAPTTPASTPAEHRIAAIWATVLGHAPASLGVHDDFFALGGHSLLAARLALRLSAELGIRLPLHQVLASPTIAGQAAWISENAGTSAAAPITSQARESGAEAPASFAQERQWFLWRLAPGSPAYHVPWAYETTGLDVAALADAVDAMIERHEIFRTTLHDHDGQVIQRIGPPWRCGLTAVPATPAEAETAARAAAGELFDLSAGPLLRVRAWATGPGAHLLLFTAHHAVIDNWSREIFERELWTLYETGADAAPAAMPPLAIQYADYSAWHRELIATRTDDDLTWWAKTLDGAEPASPPPDRSAPDRTDFAGDSATITAGPGAVAWLDAARTTASTTDFVVLLALYALFLARHTGRRDLVIGTPVSGRDHPDTAALIGFFVNTLALRIRVDPDVTFAALVTHVRQVVLDAFAHQEIPFDHVVRAVAPHRTAASNPLFTTAYAHDATTATTATLPGGLTLTLRPASGGGSHFDLSLVTARTPGGITLQLAYSTDLYDRATIDGYLNSLAALITAVSHDPGAALHTVLQPSPRERELLASWNDAAAAQSSAVPLHDLIAARAAAAPEAIAVEAADTRLTYRELDTAATTLARRLRRAGVRAGDIAGVLLGPTALAVTSVLAVWKAGAALLPLDPDLPAARITALIDDARPALVITGAPTPRPELDYLLTGLPPGLDHDQDQDEKGIDELPAVRPDHLAYLMYTSGSTGQPKAVMIHHGALSNHAVAQVLPWTRLASGDSSELLRVATGTSAFIADFFIIQLATLAGGHTLVVLTAGQRQDPRYLVALAADPDRAITAFECTTSQLQLLVEAGLLDAPHPPRLIAFGGESCPADLRSALCAHPATASFNSYGPAETTVEVTIGPIAECPVPVIGRPFGNALVRVLDDAQRPVPPGTPGELCIAGPGVGYGYLGQPAQTAAVFIPDPLGPPGSRLYRTGDLARFTRDGRVEFHGRNDHQVKIAGQRVEPGEIEAVLRDHPGIAAAAVTHHSTPSGIALTAHLIPADDTAPDPGTIRAWLGRRLPAPAIPASYRFAESFPYTTGGKLDRKALTSLAQESGLSTAPLAPPSTKAQYLIAAVWADLLGHEPGRLGVDDDFFALGGHSLLAARLALRLSADLDADVPLHQVFAHPTIAGQAAWISEHAGTPAATPIPRLAREPGAEVAASFAQERLWFLWQLAPDSPTYHVPWAYETTGLDVERLAAAVDAMISRHEVLRTTLHDRDGQVIGRIGRPWRCGLAAAAATPAEAAAAAAAAAGELFDLSAGPLLRVRAWQTGPGTHLLLFTAHHVVIDEWSLEIFERELWALYDGAGLADLPIQYADYAAWHRQLIAAHGDDDLAWWADALDGAEPASPVPDHTVPDRTDFSGNSSVVTTGLDALAWLDAARAAAATTDFVVLLAVWCLFLARHCGRRDLTIGTLVSGRDHPDTAGLVGFCVNTVALRIRVDTALTFPDHVAYVRQVVLDAFAHQEVPFEHVVRAAAPHRTAARNPLFTAAYAHESTSAATRTLPGGLTLAPRQAGGTGGSHFDLSLDTARTPFGLMLHLAYSTALYDRATIDGYLDSLTDLLATLATSPDLAVGHLLEPGLRERQLLASWNAAAATATTDTPLHDLIAAQAAADPEATAIEAPDLCLTYRELDASADRLARRLRLAGVRAGAVVGVHLRPGATAIAAILAVWKAGAAFLPLDPDLPAARITAMIDDARPALVVTDAPTPRPDLDYLLAGLPGPEKSPQAGGALPVAGAGHLAYLMYTSGSTGQPKAVMIHHGGVSNHAVAQVLPRTGPHHVRIAAGTSAFIADFFISQLATLAGGHTLVVLTRDQRQDPRYLVSLAAGPARAITALDCTTSQLQLYVESGLLDSPCPPQVISFGGEACPPDLWTTLRSHPGLTALNTYGPAETSVDATILDVTERPRPLIGRPYGNAVIRLLDDRQRPVPPGTTGELCIAGLGVGYGYLNRPAQTAAAFIPDSWGPPGSRLYRTGDLARYNRDGLLEFHGRNDQQIKILGQRIEPEEVETILRAHPQIAAAAVTAHRAPAGIQLTAHLIAADSAAPDHGTIRAWLAERLPAAAVPASFRFTTDFPLTAGGKLDRTTLTAQAKDLDAARTPGTPPATRAEHRIAAIWATLLGHDSFGVHHDFFALGGHSLLAARLALRMSAELGTDIPLHQIFARPTIAGQAAWISDHAGGQAAAPIPRQPREPGAIVPASYAQERQWFLWQLAPGSPAYHVPWAYETTGLDIDRLATAIDAMISRHEIFRTTLHDHDGQIIGRIGPPWHCGLTAIQATPREAAAAADTSASELFNLSQGPLLRVRAWTTGPGSHLLLFTAHHAVIDEWSSEIFERELWALYAAGGDPVSAGLPGLTIQYADYAAWHRELIAARGDDDLTWWKDTLDGAEPASPVPDHSVPDRTGFAGESAVVMTGPPAIAWLEATRTTAATTDFVVLLALYSLFLGRHAGRRDVIIGTPVSGRDHPDTAGLVGFCVNTLALRIHVDPASTFPGHVGRVRQVVLDAFAHQEVPFEHVVRAVAPQRSAAANPLFTTAYAHQATDSTAPLILPGGVTLTPHPAGQGGGSHFDLTLNTARTPEGLVLALEYSTSLYEPATISGYLNSLTDLLAVLMKEPAIPVSRLLEPTPREAARLREWNATATPTTTTPLHDLITAQSAATPDAIAVEAPDTTLTYRELDTAATRMARHLIVSGIRPGDIVALHLPPTATAITAILAIWKAGAAFLPLDPDLPPARVAGMINEARPARVLTATPTTHPHLDLDITTMDAEPPAVALPEVGPSQLAFLIYTSGSTGQPKAVMLHHRGVSNYTCAQMLPRLREFSGDTPVRLAAGTSAFISDFFVAQLVTLAGGHTLVLLSHEQRQDPRYLLHLARDPERAVTALEIATSQLQLLTEAGLLDAPYPPRVVIFGGEACPPDLWATLRRYPGIVAVDTYGPAETTVDATLLKVSESLVPLIGRSYGNTVVRILDDRHRPVPPGTAGELCIAGPGVGYGYLGRPAQTAAVFIPDPGGPPGSRLYRTGDLARYTAGGLLEYLGRSDLQIKILGQRVEPEEIETALRTHPDVAAAVVTPHRTPAGIQLTAHLVAAEGASLDLSALRTWLAQRLPAAAVPAGMRFVASFPTTASGKVDRKALAAEAAETGSGRIIAPPRTPAELAIAAIWAELLGHEPGSLSVHDDFFALGGHSLLAARLALRLSAKLGTRIPLHRVFANPTIADQAGYAESTGTGKPPTAITIMGGTPDLPPLVLVHPIGGTLLHYRELAGTLRTSHHILGIHADPLTTTQPATLAQRAAGYARQLAAMLNGRHPVIAGWSAGGIIAHELAVQLAAAGLQPAQLILIDTSPPGDDDSDATALNRLQPHIRQLGPGRLLTEPGADRLLAALGIDQATFAELDAPTAATLIDFWQHMLTSLARHQLAPFSGPAHLILSADHDRQSAQQAVTTWQKLTATLSITRTDAGHFQLLRQPWVTTIGHIITSPAREQTH
ncbi:MAG TPA: amino acid adenylation domain-containing protein [Streptosporangiaceae bacterium]|nr:amino acid adenylation domain-containing protein [Streptosporangiaceae bacterium]